MDQLDNVADHDENLAHLLRIAIHFGDRLQHEDEVDDKRLGKWQSGTGWCVADSLIVQA